ncbi:tRNA (adenosine(37)-N6)-threonylcarbamoyltransferase complex ATPase subunit type 1 TsaE [Thermodesulfobacteriota bacterium]
MKSKYVSCRSDSNIETIQMGRVTGAHLNRGDVIALVGELGSGKTWFTKGLGLGLGVSENTVITSPSFALLNEYSGRYPFYHIDAYRLKGLEDFFSAGLEEFFYSGGVVAIEWADRWPEILPECSVWVEIEFVDENSREIKFTGKDKRSVEIVDCIFELKNQKIGKEDELWR